MPFFCVLLCLALPSASAGENALAISYGSLLYSVDLLTGAAELIGSTDPCLNIAGLAGGPDGRIYALGSFYDGPGLCLIDPQTGAGTAIGSLGLGTGAGNLELAIDALTGRFWAVSFDGLLYQVDGLTGAATFVAPLGRRVMSLAARGNRLYVFTEISLGSYRFRLESIDPETFALTPLFDLPGNTGAATGAAFDRYGRLWFVGMHASTLQVRSFSYYRIHDLEIGGVIETFRGSYVFLDPQGGIEDLAFRGIAPAATVPALSRTGLVGLVGLLLASALLRLGAATRSGGNVP